MNKKINISEDLIKHVNKWVAVTSDYSKVVASGDSVGAVEKKLTSMKYDLNSVVVTYILPPDKFLSPTCLA